MDRKRKSTMLAVLAAVVMVCIAVLVIGLSIWAEDRRQGRSEAGKTVSAGAVESQSGNPVAKSGVEKLVDGERTDYESTGALKLGEYSGIEVDTEPGSGDVLAEIEGDLLKMKEKKKGKIKEGDYIRIRYTGYIDGKKYEDLAEEDVVLCVGELEYGDVFEESLVGREPGEKYSVSVTYEDQFPELEGETVDFKVVVKERFNDYYADKFSKGKYPTTEKYISAVKERLKEQNGTPENAGETAWETVLEDSDVKTYPAEAVLEEKETAKKQYEEFAELQGITYEEVLDGFGMDDEALAEMAEDTVKERMIAKTIAAKENLVLDDGTYQKYLMAFMEYGEEDEKTLDELVQEYQEDYGGHPKDDMLIQLVKTFIGGKAHLV